MADDIITFGTARRDPDSAIEELFRDRYPGLVRTAYGLTGDRALAELLIQDSYLRLWRRWRWISDPMAAAPGYLQRTVVTAARETVRRRPTGNAPAEWRELHADDADPEPRPAVMSSEAAAGIRIDVDSAWAELRSLRSLRARGTERRRRATLAVAASVTAAAVVATVTVALAGGRPARHPAAKTAARTVTGAPAPPRSYPGAVVARIPLAGVVSLVQDGARVWVLRLVPSASSYQLDKIDVRTNRVSLRVDLGPRFMPVVAAGGGTVWLTTRHGRALGQLVRIDPVTGHVNATLHLRAGRCGFATYGAGLLWVECSDGAAVEFLRVNPVTGKVQGAAGQVSGQAGAIMGQPHSIGSSAFQGVGIAAAPQGVWYVVNYLGVSGLVGPGSLVRRIAVRDPAAPSGSALAYAQSLTFGDGAIWVLTGDESVTRIDPATGRVVRIYSYRDYDPNRVGGLDFLAVGQNSLWFLDIGFPFSGVLRVSIATGRPLALVPAPSPGSCGQQSCWQIYATRSAVWVPTAASLIRIDPARMPG